VHNNQAPKNGFTLIEIIIAMAIFAVIMVIVMGGLNMVMRAQEQVSARAKRLGDVQMAMVVLSGDLTQIVPRPIRDNNNELIKPVLVDMTNTVRLEFTSGGVINPNDIYQRSTLQRVGYGIDNSTLIRFAWPVLDRVSNTAMAKRHLLNGVTGFRVEYVNERGEFINNDEDAIALYIDLDLGKDGHLQRYFALPGGMVNAAKS
jgi:general secretion pathway protein J